MTMIKSNSNKKSLNVWILQDGEQLPLVAGAKMMRSWRLGEELSKRGHYVTWWSSNFNHMKKQRVCSGDYDHSINEHFTLKLLESGTYLKNLSVARIKHHKILGERYRSECRKVPKPDVIVASHPIIEFSYEAVKYGKENNVPVIVDVRDMWPDTFKDYLPKIFSPLINAATYFMRARARFAFSKADAVVSMSEDVLSWALKVSRRKGFPNSDVFFISCDKLESSEIKTEKIINILEKYKDKIIISFIGTFGKTHGTEIIAKIAERLSFIKRDVLFVVGGDGELFHQVTNQAKSLDNIIFLGWLTKDGYSDLLKITDIGIIPGFNNAIPTKFGEYLSAGKPVLSSATGSIVSLINDFGVGFSYKANDFESFNAALNKILEDNKFKKMSKNAENLFNLKFNAKNVYGKYADYVEEIALGGIR